MSHNPFRKARDNQEDITPSNGSAASTLFDVQALQQEAPPKPKSTKPKKKVVIKTPPRSPEEPLRRLSLGRPPSPVPQQASTTYDFDTEAQDAYTPTDSSLDEASVNARRNSAGTTQLDSMMTNNAVKAPYNPFAKTLANYEDKYGQNGDIKETDQADGRTKPAFDVDMFKNILLNGAAPPVVQHVERGQEQDTSNFEQRFPSMDKHARPRTPDAPQIIEDESSDEEGEPVRAQEATKPAGPQTVSFDDFQSTAPSSFEGITASSGVPASPFQDADKDKPLPAPPVEQKRTSIASTDSTNTKLSIPPPPPASRRQAQHSTTAGRRRSSSVMSKSSVQSDTSSILQQSTADNSGRAPPPPPARRAHPSRPAEDATLSPSGEKQLVPPPAPAPRRAPTKVSKTEKRSPSNNSRSSLQPLSEISSSSAIPPRPPPRRGESNRSSVDGSLRSGGPDSRRVSREMTQPESQPNMLADLAALQKEVDDLFAESAAG